MGLIGKRARNAHELSQPVKTERNTAIQLDQTHTPNAINITKHNATVEATPRVESLSSIPESLELSYSAHYFDDFD